MRFPFKRRKGANASFERNWIHYWGGSPTLSNKMTHKGFLAAFQVSMLAAYWRWQYAMWADDAGMPSYRGSLSKDCNLLPLLLQMTFESPTICNCLFHIFGLSMLPNVVKETAVTIALNIRENTASQRTGQTSQPSLQNEARIKVCFFQIGPAGAAQLLPRTGRNLIATTKVQLLQGRVAQDFQQVCGPIGTFGVFVKAPGVLKKGDGGDIQPLREDGILKKDPPSN